MTIDALLTPHRSETLKAAVNRIIPADDYPSGWEAGVDNFFAMLLVRELRFLPLYQDCLDALDAEAQGLAGRGFADLNADQQDALLGHVEEGEVSTIWPHDPVRFFRLLVEQTLEGYYADPGNGGNKNGVSWDMINYRTTT